MTRSNIYIVDEGMGAANNLIHVQMCIFTDTNVYRITRDIDIKNDINIYNKIIQKLKQLQRQH